MYSHNHNHNRCWYSTTTTDEEILLFRLIYPVQVQDEVKYNDRLQLLVQQVQEMHQDVHKEEAGTRRYGYSTTTINGELIVLFRSEYRVNGMNRVQGFDNNAKYKIIQPWFHSGTSIDGDLISILIFLFRLVYRPWFQVKYKTKPFVHKDDD